MDKNKIKSTMNVVIHVKLGDNYNYSPHVKQTQRNKEKKSCRRIYKKSK